MYEFRSSLVTIFPPTVTDILDILLLTFVIYKIIQFMKETRAGVLIKGIILLVLTYAAVELLQMHVMSWLFGRIFNLGILAIIILFQPEIRRTIEKFGNAGVSTLMNLSLNSSDKGESDWNAAIDSVCDACEDFHKDNVGALIVFERETKLGEYISSGTVINAVPSKELLENIFFKNSPLHDGAVIVREGELLAAGCFLPKPQNDDLIEKSLGSRHRAAIGMSENSDAVIVVVSEENGGISLAENGELTRNIRTRDELKSMLRTRILPKKIHPVKKTDAKQVKA
ncbi:MAG: diadenylate cyclase CdaA [Oscillospiraceae bacterium]|nr:diadenylate cyclase CdaA [Oscillospiraceae bacterium]